MVEIKNHTVKTYYIAKPANHYGVVEVGDVFESGQAELETFTIEQEYLDRLEELGIEIE
jgi:hypothetical protein